MFSAHRVYVVVSTTCSSVHRHVSWRVERMDDTVLCTPSMIETNYTGKALAVWIAQMQII